MLRFYVEDARTAFRRQLITIRVWGAKRKKECTRGKKKRHGPGYFCERGTFVELLFAVFSKLSCHCLNQCPCLCIPAHVVGNRHL